ncbi:flagellar biosynthesis anti-sigma factor FlgM [Idiomarina tyrosinivorans]|uniref:Negative regulator of flagellin synthesis n=1 Tax=Idiomarina tyrosinivorans TaxID=1445662 RepID=A0A432ZPU1_9GAMM|nr:flagellar biosynthesis anti-sigma factor FlgM [Idiomarina tyrosinivorans]RUO79846.1 flagellar biosynthesis anti-sigma factor FlgM [Idiomarina tyrosinivorans]
MPINITNNGVKNTTVDTKQSTRKEDVAEKSSSAVAGKPNDAVSITDEAQQLQSLQAKAKNSSGVDQTKIDQIKQAIENGSYKIDVERLAAKLAKFESDLFDPQSES